MYTHIVLYVSESSFLLWNTPGSDDAVARNALLYGHIQAFIIKFWLHHYNCGM